MRYLSALAVLIGPAAALAAVSVTVNGSKSDVLVGAANCKTLALNTAWTLARSL